MMEYKGYTGVVNFDSDDETFYGKVINLRDVITFEADTVEGLKKEFQASVDDYLDFCKTRGENPEKPFSGKFIVRIPPELHKKIYIKSKESDKSINNYVQDILETAVS